MIYDRKLANSLLKQRQMAGGERFDEVLNGVYVMSPVANNEHQDIVSEIVAVCRTLDDWQGLAKTFAGANVTDRSDPWQENYRVPDVLAFSRDTRAIDLQTHWLGGPDLAPAALVYSLWTTFLSEPAEAGTPARHRSRPVPQKRGREIFLKKILGMVAWFRALGRLLRSRGKSPVFPSLFFLRELLSFRSVMSTDEGIGFPSRDQG